MEKKTYTVRFRCKSYVDKEELVNNEKYEMQMEAENLEGIFAQLDELIDNWDDGASILLNAPGGEIKIEGLEIINSVGEVLY